jgi:hypothetical protein
MATLKNEVIRKIVHGFYAILFISALLLISVILERRHIYF